LILDCPGNLEYQYKVTLNDNGSFYLIFDEKKLPTGEYKIYFRDDKYKQISTGTTFKKEAYRIPEFEVNLSAPGKIPLDQSFNVSLDASYYAGGRVIKRPVRWRVTQFPYLLTPDYEKGFYYSTDARFSGNYKFKSTPVLNTTSLTNVNGVASITLDPGMEPTAQPRRYIVEATVTGIDDQTVTATQEIKALPPFVLGLKLDRYYKKTNFIYPEIIAVGINNKPIKNKKIKIRLLKREWHSFLKASDFTRTSANYVTNTVDKKILEKEILSDIKPVKIKLPVTTAGVYIVEIESRDKLGRNQIVSIDLFNNHKDEPVTWSKPPSKTFHVSLSKKEYKTGDNASVILESPFQKARVLSVIEEPDGNNIYSWINIDKGKGIFNFKIKESYTPKIPIHFVLMRGRIDSGKKISVTQPDLSKPITLSSSKWILVNHDHHKIKTELEYPKKSMPGKEIDITVHLSDMNGNPLDGEMSLWLVDQSILSLASEKRIDPLPDFIAYYPASTSFHDTRNMIFGRIPLSENPGGGVGLSKMHERKSILNNVTVRKNFNPVPYFNPNIRIDKSGSRTVKVKLPDNLTNFKIRAKVVSGENKFGFATGHLAIRLPVVINPSLPRFLRYGDKFTAVAISRITDGESGPGRTEIKSKGLNIKDSTIQNFEWDENNTARLEYKIEALTPETLQEKPGDDSNVTLTIGVERLNDGARDAFKVKLPILPDRKRTIRKTVHVLEHGSRLILPELKEKIRKGTLKRKLLISGNKDIIPRISGLEYLFQYPHQCTEQRISRARAMIASLNFKSIMNDTHNNNYFQKTIVQTLNYLESIQNENGLASYWPGTMGYISLTAWVVDFMVEAKEADFEINNHVFDSFINALKKSLRTDFTEFTDGNSFAERTWALEALTNAGESDSSYASELVRNSNFLNPESLAQVTRALYLSGESVPETIDTLLQKIKDSIQITMNQGKKLYSGIQTDYSLNELILTSETRTISEILKTLASVSGTDQEIISLLSDALIKLGHNNGWGDTNANSSALIALNEVFDKNKINNPNVRLKLKIDHDTKPLILTNSNDIKQKTINHKRELGLSYSEESNRENKSLYLREEISFINLKDGSYTSSEFNGFAVTRNLIRVGTDSKPDEKMELNKPGLIKNFKVGNIIEEHIEIVCPETRHFVAVVVPLAAGMEPLNPILKTAPPEAKPKGQNTMNSTYTLFSDNSITYYYNTLPLGTYHFYFRTRAQIPGLFTQPPAYAEKMYDQTVNGNGNGAKINISK